MSKLISGETNYDPSKEYYFLDYSDGMDIRWVRSPYMTLEEIQIYMSDHLPFVYDKDQKKCVPMFSNFRITPMKKLEELYSKWNEVTKEWEDDTITLAAKQFGDRYDGYEWLEGPAPSLTQKGDESTEEWKVRVQQRRDELKKQLKEKCLLELQTRDKALENHSNERIALLQGWRRRKDELDSFRFRQQEEQNSETSGVGFG